MGYFPQDVICPSLPRTSHYSHWKTYPVIDHTWWFVSLILQSGFGVEPYTLTHSKLALCNNRAMLIPKFKLCTSRAGIIQYINQMKRWLHLVIPLVKSNKQKSLFTTSASCQVLIHFMLWYCRGGKKSDLNHKILTLESTFDVDHEGRKKNEWVGC